jgi:hypothetical protein
VKISSFHLIAAISENLMAVFLLVVGGQSLVVGRLNPDTPAGRQTRTAADLGY